MNNSNTNIKSFINDIIKFDNVNDILNQYKSQTDKGFVFERLFDIVIKFGFCDIFINNNYNHLIGNSNEAKLKNLENYNQYLQEKVISSKSSGCSDITLLNNNNENIIIDYTRDVLSKMKVIDLKSICKNKKISKYSLLKKEGLIDIILQSQGSSSK